MAILVSALIFLLSKPIFAATEVGDYIYTTTWTVAESPYLVTSHITIPPSETLVIEAGVDVLLADGVRIIVNGGLHVRGTAADSVRFLPLTPDSDDRWNGILIDGGPGATFSYCRISGAYRSVAYSDDGGGLCITDATVYLSHCVISHNMLRVFQPKKISTSGTGGGVAITGRAQVRMDWCRIVSNGMQFYADPGGFERWLTGSGGGVGVREDAQAHFWNCTFNGNFSEYGYAVAGNGDRTTLDHCVVWGNFDAPDTEAPDLGLGNAVALAEVTNSIIYNNECDPVRMPQLPDDPEIRYSIVQPTTEALLGDNLLRNDPMFVDPSDGDFTTAEGSVAIAAADPTTPGVDGQRTRIGLDPLARSAGMALVPLVIHRSSGRLFEDYYITSVSSDPISATLVSTTGFLRVEVYPSDTPLALGESAKLDIHPNSDDDDFSVITLRINGGTFPAVDVYVHLRRGTTVLEPIASGVWTLRGSPYRILTNVNVPSDSILTIEPGTEIVFDADVSLSVMGSLRAHGTELQPVRFRSGESAQWGGLLFSGGDSSALSYTVITDAHTSKTAGASVDPAYLEIPYSRPDYRSTGGGIYVSGAGTRLVMRHCRIAKCEALTQYYVGANLLGSKTIHEGMGGAVAAKDSAFVDVDGCAFVSNDANILGGAVSVSNEAVVRISRSVFHDNYARPNPYSPQGTGGVVNVYNGNMTLEHCTFGINRSGAIEVSQGSNIDIVNTIFSDGAWINVDTTSVMSVRYCLVDRERSGIGNIVGNAQFADAATGDYNLTRDSPARDAGDPAFDIDPDGTRTDIGRYWYPTPVGVADNLPGRFALHQNMPNPFNPVSTIAFDIPNDCDVQLVVYTMSGQVVRSLVDDRLNRGSHFASWNGTDDLGNTAASGVYLYRLAADDRIAVRRMILLR
jgi:hypothetical protein